LRHIRRCVFPAYETQGVFLNAARGATVNLSDLNAMLRSARLA
jgi:phosphoglycerate dehydrogenase-like enzyme